MGLTSKFPDKEGYRFYMENFFKNNGYTKADKNKWVKVRKFYYYFALTFVIEIEAGQEEIKDAHIELQGILDKENFLLFDQLYLKFKKELQTLERILKVEDSHKNFKVFGISDSCDSYDDNGLLPSWEVGDMLFVNENAREREFDDDDDGDYAFPYGKLFL